MTKSLSFQSALSCLARFPFPFPADAMQAVYNAVLPLIDFWLNEDDQLWEYLYRHPFSTSDSPQSIANDFNSWATLEQWGNPYEAPTLTSIPPTQNQVLSALYDRISAGITTHEDTLLLQSIILDYDVRIHQLQSPTPLPIPTPHVNHQDTQGSETS